MKIVFIVGPHGSGKTTTALQKIYGYQNEMMIDTGPLIRSMHQNQMPSISIKEWISMGEKEYGKRFTDNLILNSVKDIITKQECIDLLLIIGYRTLSGLKYLKWKLEKEIKGEYYSVYFHSDEDILRDRYNKRESLNLSPLQFYAILADQEKELLKLKRFSDYIIYNNSSIDQCLGNFKAIIANLN